MANKEQTAQIDNKALKEALTTLKNERTAANEQKMFAELKKANLLAPVIFSVPIPAGKTGKIKLPKDAKIKYVIINTKDGKAFFPAFTDMEEAQKLAVQPGQTVQYIARTLADYDLIANDKKNGTLGVVLNPMSDNIVLPTDLVNRLNRGEIAKSAPVNVPQEVRYGEPSVYPTALVNAVYDKCCELKTVDRVWLKAMYVGMVMQYALFVEAEKVDANLADTLKETAEKESKGVTVVVMKTDKKIMDTIIQDAVALYDKELDF
ncbi:MAG: SseB family protein [Bulleidia sp.]|nr:SseB family protein [Bulleidia sp.]